MRLELSLGDPPLEASQEVLAVAFDNYLHSPVLDDINQNIRQFRLRGWVQMEFGLFNDER
jgi:hypothetical protein